jgi:hypothetical protein
LLHQQHTTILNYQQLRGAAMGQDGTVNDMPEHQPILSRFLLKKSAIVVAVVAAVAIGGLVTVSRSDASSVVPNLIGTRVDPQLDGLRLRLETANLALGEVSIRPCPEFDVPGASLERIPGTIIAQHPQANEAVAASTRVDVTVCLPSEPIIQ